MSVYNPAPNGLGAVGSYQVSGIPFFKSSITADDTIRVIEFPYVTNWIHIVNREDVSTADGPLIAFSENGFDTNNYFQVNSHNFHVSSKNPLYLKITKLYYKRVGGQNVNFDIVAGLTNISTGSIQSNWSGSAGVG
jgi:hypothetical protein